MLTKLSLRNAKKTFSDYAIYILTVSLMVMLNFMLNRLIFSSELASMGQTSMGMQMMFAFASFIMLIVVYALIKYMTHFILNRRSKEFGLYQLMGIENKRIKHIYWIEQFYLAGISMLIGIPAGMLVGELLRSIVFNYIGCVDYRFTLEGMGRTIVLTVVETLIIYLFVRLTGRKLFKGRTILNWLQAERKNEKVKKNGKGRYAAAMFWLLMCVATIAALEKVIRNSSITVVLSCIGVLLLSTFGFATCLLRIINDVLLRNNNCFTLRVLHVRFVAKRIATRSKQIGILSMLFVGSIGLLAVGMLFANYTREFSKEYMGFDFYYTPSVKDGADTEFIEGMEELLKKSGIDDKYYITGYYSEESELYKIFDSEDDYDVFVSLSDYNRVREMLGQEEIKLNKNEFMIQTHLQLLSAADIFTETEYHILGQNMRLKSLEITPLNTQCVANGDSYYVVVPDEFLKDLAPAYHSYAYQLSEETDYDKLETELLSYAEENSWRVDKILMKAVDSSEVKSSDGYCLSSNFRFTKKYVQDSAAAFAAMAISILFMGIVFSLVLSTILAILLTSEIGENKQRFLTLHRLGMAVNEQEKVLRKQITSLFSLPVVVGLPLAVAVCIIVAGLFSDIMTTAYMSTNIVLTIISFMFIYFLYMTVTYRSLCKGVIEGL